MNAILSPVELSSGGPVAPEALVEANSQDVIAELMAEYLASAGWGVTEGLGLDPDHLSGLKAEVETLHRAGKLAHAGIGRGHDQQLDLAVRGDCTAWLDGRSKAQAALFQRFAQLQQHFNRSLYLGLTHFEAHFAAFDKGAFYRAHRDSFKGRTSRVVSLVLYLNEAWKPANGGQLRVYGSDGTVAAEVSPEMGRAVCFLSEEVLHEVRPAMEARFSIACWFRADLPGNLAFRR